MSELTMKFGQKVKSLRIEHGLTQKELAEAAGTSHITISSIEAGKTETNLGLVERIAKQLSVPVSDLFQSQQKLNVPIRRTPDKPKAMHLFEEATSLLASLNEAELAEALAVIKGFVRAKRFAQQTPESADKGKQKS